MSWGTELWDQYENVAVHTQKGIDFLDRYGQFLRERCIIEMEYAAKLRKLVKNYQPKKKEEDENQFTTCRAFLTCTNELIDLAGQHEIIAETLTSGIIKEIGQLIRELKDERKRHLHDGSRVQQNLQNSLSQLDKTKKTYEKAFKEAEKSQEHYVKVDADLNLSRADVEKSKNLATQKNQQCEDCKNEYASQLQKTNELQAQHYSQLMPATFQQLQDLDCRRITCFQGFMSQAADIERQVMPIVLQCLDGITKAAESINPQQDIQLVIEKFKSGYTPPPDIPFEDLTTSRNNSICISEVTNGENSSIISIHNGSTLSGGHSATLRPHDTLGKGTLSGSGKTKKRGGLFGIFGSNKNGNMDLKEDYSDLPPQQRRKKLQQKMDQISAHIQQETATRDGLAKMKGVYEQNPTLGDPTSIEGQLTENGYRLDKLRQDLHKYQSYMADAEGRSLTPTSNLVNGVRKQTNSESSSVNGSGKGSENGSKERSSLSEDSLSRSASDSSVSNPHVATSKCNQNNQINSKLETQRTELKSSTPVPTHGSPESGIGTSIHPISLGHDLDFDAADDCGDYFDCEPLPILGTCRALYPFDATSEGAIPMNENEEMYVVELDAGDGWTRVRRTTDDSGNGAEEGFVPTSYVECFLYESNNTTT